MWFLTSETINVDPSDILAFEWTKQLIITANSHNKTDVFLSTNPTANPNAQIHTKYVLYYRFGIGFYSLANALLDNARRWLGSCKAERWSKKNFYVSQRALGS